MFCFPRNLAAHNSHLKTLFSSLLFEFIIIRSKLTYLEITRRIFNGSIFFPFACFLSTNIPFYSTTLRVVHFVRLLSVAVHFNITRLTSFRIELLVFDMYSLKRSFTKIGSNCPFNMVWLKIHFSAVWVFFIIFFHFYGNDTFCTSDGKKPWKCWN